jgi:ABC-type ATPase involved in cell division
LPIVPRAERLTFDEVVKAVINDYIVNGKRSLRVVERRINKHLLPYFGGKRMAGISTATVNAYVAHRLAQGIRNRNGERIKDVSNAEINRELDALKRAFSLAMQSGRLAMRPHIGDASGVSTAIRVPRTRSDRLRRSASAASAPAGRGVRLHHRLATRERGVTAGMAQRRRQGR